MLGHNVLPEPIVIADTRADFRLFEVNCDSIGDPAPSYARGHYPVGVISRPPQSPVTRLILALLAAYKRLLSPLFGSRCRFDPSCSDYARVAIARFGAARGGLLALWRLARCQPLCEGGSDPVPQSFTFRRSPHEPSP